MTVYDKLINIQSELKAPKSQYNNFGKYSYRNCEDILEALKPLLNKNKATVFISDDIVFIEGKYVSETLNTKTDETTTKTTEGRFYVKSTVTFVDVETGDKIVNTAYAREEESKKGMDVSQVTGASSSYARKYALNGMFAIDDTKDSDFTNQNESKSSSKPSNGLTESQIKRLFAIANKVNISSEDVKIVVAKSYGIHDIKKMNKQQYDEICERLEKKGSK